MLRESELADTLDAAPARCAKVKDADAILAMVDYRAEVALERNQFDIVEIAHK